MFSKPDEALRNVNQHTSGMLRVTQFLRSLFSTEGRIGRQTFWVTSIGLFVALMINILIAGFLGARSFPIVVTPGFAIFLWAKLATQAKRWHDRGKPGWMVLIAFIPVFGLIWAFVELGLLEGTARPNRYGEDPLQPQDDGTEDAGYGLLDQATRLERDGRIEEALAAYEEIAQGYAHTSAGPDAQRSAESVSEKSI